MLTKRALRWNHGTFSIAYKLNIVPLSFDPVTRQLKYGNIPRWREWSFQSIKLLIISWLVFIAVRTIQTSSSSTNPEGQGSESHSDFIPIMIFFSFGFSCISWASLWFLRTKNRSVTIKIHNKIIDLLGKDIYMNNLMTSRGSIPSQCNF